MRYPISALLCVLLSTLPAMGAGRPTQQIFADIAQADYKIDHISLPQQLLDPKYRESIRPILQPLLEQRQSLYEEWAAAQPKANADRDFLVTRNTAELAYLGDEKAQSELQKKASSLDATDSAAGTVGMAMTDWLNANGKPEDQNAILQKVAPLVANRPGDQTISGALFMMLNHNPATAPLAGRAGDLLASMKTPLALTYKAKPNQLGKPLRITGTTVAGKPIDLSKYHGKVVMIDFWATWCPPCMAELPHVVETYNKFHSQGLEIIGVSSDQSRPAFVTFLKEHPDVAWPQLCNGGAAWHPLTKLYGIDGIPTVYLVDRAGLLRSMTARGATDELIPALLAEPVADATTQPAVKTQSQVPN